MTSFDKGVTSFCESTSNMSKLLLVSLFLVLRSTPFVNCFLRALIDLADQIEAQGLETVVEKAEAGENILDFSHEYDDTLLKKSPVLKTVGFFMAAHKYFSKDVRFPKRALLEERSHFKHFPIPRLKRFHVQVQKACEKGASECVEEVYSKAKQFNADWKDDTNKFHPFFDELDLFQYRTTASYYLCMFTLERNQLMRKPFLPHECLRGFNETREVRESKDKVGLVDWRLDNLPFRCSEIYYCPDPCYGRQSFGNVKSRTALKTDPGNPCRHLKSNRCKWADGRNNNFEGLIRNRFNVSCACDEELKGFYMWSSQFSMCVDLDECYEGTAECEPDKMCLNNKGGYSCVCKRGTKLNTRTQRCEQFLLLPKLKKTSSVKGKSQASVGLLRTVEILLGLSSAGHILIPEVQPLYAVIVTFLVTNIR